MNDKTEIRTPMTRERLYRGLASGPSESEGQSPSVRRGDHNLNPGTAPAAALTPAAVLVPLIARAEGMTVIFTHAAEYDIPVDDRYFNPARFYK